MIREKWALITGASSGIGWALALRFAKEGWNLAVVARDAEKLSELAKIALSKYHIQTVVIPKDLTSSEAPKEIFDELNSLGIRIDALINNAGAGFCGLFKDIESDNDDHMIDLNIRALTSLSKLAVRQMNGNGRILNVASTGSYQPGPYIAVYYATKAYVLSLTRAMRSELKESGIIVCALCPGSTATAFSHRAGKKDIKGAMPPDKVADLAYKGFIKGKAVIIPGFHNKVFIAASKLMPAVLSAAIVKRIQRRLTDCR